MKIKKFNLIITTPVVLGLAIAPIVSCSKKQDSTIHVESVEIDNFVTQEYEPGTKYNYVFNGETKKLNAKVLPENATDKSFTWSVSNPLVASIDAEGNVTGLLPGLTTITATSNDGAKKHELFFGVLSKEVKAKEIKVENIPSPSTIYIGEFHELTASILPTEAVQLITWSSSDPTVASIEPSETGNKAKIQGLKEGDTTIKATNYDGSVKYEFTLHVAPIIAKEIVFGQSSYVIVGGAGATVEIKAKIKPENTTDQTLEWKSSDPLTATVDQTGIVTAVKQGTVTITATNKASGITCSTIVVISDTHKPVQKISFESDSVQYFEQQAINPLNVKFEPTDATVQNIKWSSTNTSVATVGIDGSITTKTPGETDIIATSLDYQQGQAPKTATCHLTVKEDPQLIKQIKIEKNGYNFDLSKGKIPAKVNVQRSPETAVCSIVYQIEDENIAEFNSSTNEITPKAKGVTKLKVTATDRRAEPFYAEATVNVYETINVESIKINKPYYAVNLSKGQTVKAMATISPVDATKRDLKWYTDKPDIISINETTGDITGIKQCDFNNPPLIWAESTDGTKIKSNQVPVYSADFPAVDGVQLDKTSINLNTNKIESIKATVVPYDRKTQLVEWTSSDPSVAMYSNGNVIALKQGTTTLTATSVIDTDKSASCTVTVTDVPVESVTISPDITEIDLHKKTTLTATVNPKEATDKRITWTSSNPDVARIDENGLITPTEKGKVTFTATSVWSKQISSSKELTIKSFVDSLTLNKDSLGFTTLDPSSTQELVATVKPYDADNPEVDYSVDNDSIVDVKRIPNSLNRFEVKPKAVGDTNIKFTTQFTTLSGAKLEKKCHVHVSDKPIYAEKIVITNLDQLSVVAPGGGANIQAQVLPEYTTDKSLTYSSSDESVAAVYPNGHINTFKQGQTTIKVSAKGAQEKPVETEFVLTVFSEACKVTFTNDGKGVVAPSTITIPKGLTIRQAINNCNVQPKPVSGYKFNQYVDQDGKPIDLDSQILNDLTIKATFEKTTFETDSWENVIKYANQGLGYLRQMYGIDTFIGRSRIININDQKHIVRVIGENHDVLASDPTRRATLTFELSTLLSMKNGFAVSTELDGTWNLDYLNSIFRKNLTGKGSGTQTLSKTVWEMLASEPALRSELGIKNVTKKVTVGGRWEDWHITSYTDKLFALTVAEMAESKEGALKEGTAYKYWADRLNPAYRIKRDINGNVKSYWLTTSNCRNTSETWYIHDDGYARSNLAFEERGISFAFCI